jgi:hypothetical protein
MLICVAALLLKLLVPAGYMIDRSAGGVTITLCGGTAPAAMTMTMAGMHGGGHHGPSKPHGKAEMPCAFSGLSAAALGAIDPIQLAALIAFVLAAGIAARRPPAPARAAYWRPPAQGPPTRP